MTYYYKEKSYKAWLKRIKVGQIVEVMCSGFVKNTYSNAIVTKKSMLGHVEVEGIEGIFKKGICCIDGIRYYQLGPISLDELESE